MFYIHVIVEDPPKVLYERAVNIAHIIDTGTFEDLLLEVISNQFLDKHVLVFGREKKDDKWILLQDGLTDYFASEIWASEKYWAEIISEIFSLTSMIQKYAKHLQKSSQLTYNAHHSTTVVRTPNKYSKLLIILGVLNINSKYRKLEKILAKKDFYEFIEISEFLPTESIKHH
ncbi:12727_t:CDS:2 [Cetraspora pellucida]|uniref:12727_t:CDS:1 n=1 Tax=Cetraspora pellucida TaxID=1433469 RepID=A0A9N9NL61_9GLOM|nr:12727_t:CDS:2 [Cetraspora pellucida]